LLGDLIDKGPSPDKVLETVFLDELPNIQIKSIMGNHEEKAIRWLRKKQKELAGGPPNDIQNKWDFEAIGDFLDFMVAMPLWVSLPEYNVTLIHGGIPANMERLPDPCWDKASKADKMVLRTRYLSSEGKPLQLGAEDLECGDRWWAELYDGRFGTVIYGHQSFPDVRYDSHAIGIDTGCVYGNKLTALLLKTDGKHEVISMEATDKYAPVYGEEECDV
jgi:bis(5'-nucleosyl)-tetraphosphatase (symmetrical)